MPRRMKFQLTPFLGAEVALSAVAVIAITVALPVVAIGAVQLGLGVAVLSFYTEETFPNRQMKI